MLGKTSYCEDIEYPARPSTGIASPMRQGKPVGVVQAADKSASWMPYFGTLSDWPYSEETLWWNYEIGWHGQHFQGDITFAKPN